MQDYKHLLLNAKHHVWNDGKSRSTEYITDN